MAFECLVSFLDRHEYVHSKNTEELSINISFSTEDISLKHTIYVNRDLPIVILLSTFPFRFSEARIPEAIVACNMVNFNLMDGCFSIDENTGNLYFQLCINYGNNGHIDDDVFDYLFRYGNSRVDRYNDLFYDLSKKKIDLQRFHELSQGL